MFKRACTCTAAAVYRTASINPTSASFKALTKRTPVTSVTLLRPASSSLLRLHRQYSSSAPSSSSSDTQDLVIKTLADLMQLKDDADKEKITLKSHLKDDLGLDIFKTYQLLDKVEQEIESIDISIDEADKATTVQDIVDLISKARRQ
ncbi:hypothetical protein BG011_003830 [Mortierella polycephala]|uniref:Carrier domain-containing protein n=1 Tax=Mortierella polycephala TaxID=41804 RepID=A0A9P6QGR7_9FUNG|nr:hypothetical protein BG011_003830 [Mortierella polycephala]